MKIKLNEKYQRTYKTEANLDKALDKLNLPESARCYQVELNGRYTAIFTNLATIENSSYFVYVASKGFLVVG